MSNDLPLFDMITNRTNTAKQAIRRGAQNTFARKAAHKTRHSSIRKR